MSFLTKIPVPNYDPNAFASFSNEEGFAIGTGKAMAWMSQLAYELDEPQKVNSILQAWGLSLNDDGIIVQEVATVLPLASTHLFVAGGRDATVVSFAGTDPLTLANWISDFDVHPSSTDTAEGFARAADVVWPRIDAVLRATSGANPKIFVTGHSLGGALAALTAKRIADSGGFNLIGVYTFGMPRVGGEEWHSQYNEALGQDTFRLVYGDDLVPTVAPSNLGFRHIGRLLRCNAGGKFDQRELAPDSESDEPLFEAGVAKDLQALLNDPGQLIAAVKDRLQVAAGRELGVGPSNTRSDLGAVAIELLPPRLRDHIPDRYISALAN
jgi:triacylglycerol lipase